MIKVLKTDGKTVVSVNGSGRIDLKNGEELYKTVLQYMEKDHTIVLNLKKVIFIDTNGFNKLESLKLEADKTGCKIELSHMSEALSELFNLMELNDLFVWTESNNLSGKRLVLN